MREHNRRYRERHPDRRRESCRKWAKANPDKVKAAAKRSRERHAEKRNAQTRLWKSENKAHVRAYNAQWVKENPEKKKVATKRSRLKNADKIRARQREFSRSHRAEAKARVEEWRRQNPHLRKQQLRRQRFRRRALKMLQQMPGVSHSEWSEIEELFDGRCAYCLGEASSIDHVVALSVGGQDEASNVVPACRRCNSSKGAKSLLTWLLTSDLAQDALSRSLSVVGKLKG